MRKIVLAAAVIGAALTLAACSERSDDARNTTAGGAAAERQSNTDAPKPSVGNATAGAVLNANTATAAQLAGTNALSPGLAEAIVAGRPYGSVVDLNAKLRETLPQDATGAVLEKVFVPVNLNTASREEIELIPGMTSRMVGEFLEYRPYEDINEFNREIGKYVDEAEVARFRTYVTL